MTQPNILVICSDQHHPRISGYRGHPHARTPHLDRLAAQGTRFTRAYCTSPVCTPSRMSFITGKYPHQIGNWMIGVPLDPKEMTWPRRLSEAGIRATMLGKMDFCGPYQDGGFTDHKIIERRSAWKIYPRQSPFPARLRGYTRPDKRQHLLRSGIRADQVTDGSDGHNDAKGFYDHDRVVTQWALDFLKQKGESTSREPWALYVGLLYPHWPFCVPRRYFDLYYPDNLTLPHDARFPNKSLHPALRHFQQALDLGEVDEETLRRTVAAYYGMITAMDERVGLILKELETQGLSKDTWVVYTSDHGESLGEHGLFYKQCSYEGSVGVPLIVRGPGAPAGGSIDHPVTLVDLYPTILDMAGIASEPGLPGRSWLPLMRGERADRPDYAFSEFHGNFLRQDWYMLAKGDYKYTWYAKERPSLFNIARDPLENHDLASDPSKAGILREFEILLRGILDPDEVSLRAKRDLGLIGPDDEDYTETLTFEELRGGIGEGRFPPEGGYAR